MIWDTARCFLIIFIYAAFDITASNAWLNWQPCTTTYALLNEQSLCSRCRIPAMSFRPSVSRSLESEKLDLKLLVIDHYDSFTFNLVDILAQYCVHPPIVVPADSASNWDKLLSQQVENSNDDRPYDGVVLSPGPGHPGDIMSALSRDCVRKNPRVPILGVCLGHQILGTVYGANVTLAPEPVHGQVRPIRLLTDDSADPLWKSMADSTKEDILVTRYHSLHVTELKGTNLKATAVSDDADSVVMALRHLEYPHFGVQFHPESVGTNETGKILLRNFVQFCANGKAIRPKFCTEQRFQPGMIPAHRIPSAPVSLYSVYIHKVPLLPPNGANMCPLDIMDEFLCHEQYSFWLDDSLAGSSKRTGISILGSSRHRVEYWGPEKEKDQQGVFVWNADALLYQNQSMNIFSYLREKHASVNYQVTMVYFENMKSALERRVDEENLDILPFAFRGGHVGFLGYEVRHDTYRYHDPSEQTATTNPSVPTSAFLWADKSFVYDHQNQEWYLVGVASLGDDPWAARKADILNWMRSMSARLRRGVSPVIAPKSASHTSFPFSSKPRFTPNRSRNRYSQNFAQCIEFIRQGESYELCLTNQLESRIPSTFVPFNLYKILRRRNPAPFSAYFQWNPIRQGVPPRKSGQRSAFAICCSSPERFASVKRIRTQERLVMDSSDDPPMFQVEAKPIKGTIARILPSNGRNELTAQERIQDALLAQQLSSSVKDRAENLMIVDLLRNDLSQVCETGSVHVAKLMDIETYATVHQMVSTIRGQLRPTKTAVDVLQACFPGGSMTGAPKIRTMELLHELEDRVCRGPYSGCLGYISLNGCMDMNIVIRTAVVTPHGSRHCNTDTEDEEEQDSWNVSVGAGGAITALSQANDEYDEMMLKASAVVESVQEWASLETEDASFIAEQRMNETFVSNWSGRR